MSKETNRQLEFSKSIIPGVEIKRCRNTPHAYKAHLHNELSLGIIIEGETDLSFNDDIIQFKTGDGVIIPPMITHRCEPKDIDHWCYIMLYIDPTYYGEALGFTRSRRLKGEDADRLMHFISQLMDEQDSHVSETILVDLLLSYCDRFEETAVDHGGRIMDENQSGLQGVGDMSEIRHTTDAIKAYILEHIYDVISLEQLETVFGLGKFSIIRQFKKHFAVTPAAFHLQNRVAEAKKRLNEGQDVLDACMVLNFYDQAHFIKEFKKTYGVTPLDYVRQIN